MTIIKTFETNPEENKKGFSKRYIAFAFMGIFMLVILEIWANNTIISYGGKFENLSNVEKSLKMENQILENEIAQKASLTNIASKSAQLGFSTAASVQYIR